VEKITALATDARDVTDTVRRRVTDLMDTVADVNHSLRELTKSAELRVREFGAVVDVVKGEAEELLIEGAATARGIHTTVEALRRVPPPTPAGAPASVAAEEDAPPVRRSRRNSAPAPRVAHADRAEDEDE
jgi:hypothetical protein